MRPGIMLPAAVILMLCALGCAIAAEVAGHDAEKELRKLQGTWVMLAGERDGKPATDERVKQSKLVYKGARVEIFVPHRPGGPIVADLVKIDTTKSPKELHFIRRNGPSAGETLIGIYEFTGNDQYRFAFDPSGRTILKEFATKPGTGYIMNTWKRDKP